MAPRRIRRGGNSEDFQLMFLGDVDSGGDGSTFENGDVPVWDEVAEKFLPTTVGPANGLSQGIVDALNQADTPGVANPFMTELAVNTIVNAAKVFVNVKDSGASGDGLTDDTASIQGALNTAHALGGGVVFFPSGTYLISDELVYYANEMLFGVPGSSIIQNDTGRGASDYIMLIPDPNTTVTNVIISGLTFDQRSDSFGFTTSDQCVSINEVSGVTIRDCVFKNIITMAIWADTKTADTTTSNVRIENCWIQNSEGAGISVFGDVRDIVITRNRVESCKDDGIGIQNLSTGEQPVNIIVSDNTILNCNRRNSQSSTPHAILIFGCLDSVVTGNLIDSTCAPGISIQAGASSTHSVRSIVSKNIVKNAGVTPDSTAGVPGHGIMVLTADSVQVVDNIVLGSRQYGIGTATVDWLTLAHNRLDSNTSGTISIASCTNVTQWMNGETTEVVPTSLELNGVTAGKLSFKSINLANNAAAQFPLVAGYGSGAMGFAFVISIEDGNSAIFIITGGNVATYEVSDPVNQFSAVKDTASSTNIYNEGISPFTYYIQNKRGSERNYAVFFFTN